MYNRDMRIIKNFFYAIMIIIMLACAGILIVALSPELTDTVSKLLYGEEGPEAYMEKHSSSDEVSEDEVMEAPANRQGIAAGVLASEEGAGYVAPIRGEVKLPDKVSGKSGYESVTGQNEELGEEQADALGASLKTGETGESLTFDKRMYPYYHLLNTRMQSIYRQIYANAQALNDSFAPVETVNVNQLKHVFEAVYNDHPELFWLDTQYSCKHRADGTCVEITLQYNRTAQNLAQAKEEFAEAAEEILDKAKEKDTDEDKEFYVHNALIKKADYAGSSAMNQSAYSALVNGDTVCAGYARAFQYLMQQLDIPCYYCTGYSGEDHAWNIIQIDGKYYNVDVTWDDTDPTTIDYFNKSDAELVGTHVRTGLSVYLPVCGEPDEAVIDDTYLTGGNVVAGVTLNPNPTQPLDWEPKEDEEHPGSFVSGNDLYDLNEAGLTEDMVQTTLKDYYASCLKQMVDRGSGQKAFSNVVPKYVLVQVEKAYGTGDYEKGYVNEALKKLEMDHFAIQIQVRDLGGNYYRLYHNINTWVDEEDEEDSKDDEDEDSDDKADKDDKDDKDSDSSTKTYQTILDEYTEKLKEATPRLIEEYKKAAASNTSGVGGLAELSTEKILELADIYADGILEMADLMWSEVMNDSGSYSEYEEWAGKLNDVYMEEADKITEAYMNSIE